jgi:benzoyl-CoA reductase/2-hydroxyglutaryl-CoA dehydratase subunit BcrC/BadD/HgdB
MLRQLKSSIPALSEGILRRSLPYDLMAGPGKHAFTGPQRRSKALWLELTAGQLAAARHGRGPVVWGNAFFPFELLYGLGVTPCRPETVAALAANIGLGQGAIGRAESGSYSPDTCSFYRCALGLDIAGLLPPPDFAVASTHLCDGATKAFYNFSRKHGCEYFLIDVPYHETPGAVAYLAGQLEELAGRIAAKQGKPLDKNKLAGAIRLSNEAREYMVKVNELREISPCPLAGSDAISYILDMQFFGPGSRPGARFFKVLYEELKEKVARGEGAVREEKHRLLWLHYIKPYYPNDIFSFLGERGASIVFGEANQVYWPPLDPARPFESLAAKMLANPSGGPLERRAGQALELVDRYHIDGVIHFSHWGCRQSCGGELVIRDMMRKKGVPLLVLDGDGADSRNYSKEQTRLRLEAFLEMLEARR